MTDTPTTGAQQPPRTFLVEILRRAVHAPSGDNSQPWRFRLDKGAIVLFNLPNADATLYNFRQRGSYVAHGALIENLSILAAEQGYHCDIELFPNIPDATARISFTAAAPVAVPLAHAIEQRTTNRKPYRRVPLETEHRGALLEAVERNAGIKLRYAEGKESLALLARTVSVNERLLMENRTLHDFLFGIIRWSREEERAKPGLYLKTMELPPPVQL
ncbi:MAG: nitroreductase, partial [bacterium]|nr:nitroreductase [bacterium]